MLTLDSPPVKAWASSLSFAA